MFCWLLPSLPLNIPSPLMESKPDSLRSFFSAELSSACVGAGDVAGEEEKEEEKPAEDGDSRYFCRERKVFHFKLIVYLKGAFIKDVTAAVFHFHKHTQKRSRS